MMSYEMIGVADQNGRVYESKYGTYCKENGFELSDIANRLSKVELIDALLHENCWSLQRDAISKKNTAKEQNLNDDIELLTKAEMLYLYYLLNCRRW